MKIKLKNNCSILVDFDGTITEDNIYPEMGSPRSGIRQFLNKCKTRKIRVYIWSARCNNGYGFTKNSGTDSIKKVKAYMRKHKLYYTDIFIHTKPIGHGDFGGAAALLDDKATNRISDLEFE